MEFELNVGVPADEEVLGAHCFALLHDDPDILEHGAVIFLIIPHWQYCVIHHAVDHAADFTLSNSPQVTHLVHSLCQHILLPFFPLTAVALSLSRWPWSPPLHRINDHELMARNPLHNWWSVAFISHTINRFQTFRATLTVSLFMLYVKVRNQRPRDFLSWLPHKTLHSSNQIHSHQVHQHPHNIVPQFNLVHCLSQPQPFHLVVPYDLPLRRSELQVFSSALYLCGKCNSSTIPSLLRIPLHGIPTRMMTSLWLPASPNTSPASDLHASTLQLLLTTLLSRLHETPPTSLWSRCTQHTAHSWELPTDLRTTFLEPVPANVNLQPVFHVRLSKNSDSLIFLLNLALTRKHIFALTCTSDLICC